MRTQQELTSFIVLRSNGWSLAKISKQLNIPKTTLFHWEQANAETIHLFKYVQLEKIQEQYVPSYEEQLKDTREHLAKIQDALKQHDYSKMSPEFLLQMNFQLQTRLDKIRQQVPLCSPQLGRPMEALPPIGCVTKDRDFPYQGDFSDDDPTVEEDPELSSSVGRDSVEPSATSEHGVPPSGGPATNGRPSLNNNGAVKVNGHANGNDHLDGNASENGHPNLNGSRNGTPVDPCLPVAPKPGEGGSLVNNQNGTFWNENPPGVKNGPLQINNLEQQKRNNRSV